MSLSQQILKKHSTKFSIINDENFQQTRNTREFPQPDKEHVQKTLMISGERLNVCP